MLSVYIVYRMQLWEGCVFSVNLVCKKELNNAAIAYLFLEKIYMIYMQVAQWNTTIIFWIQIRVQLWTYEETVYLIAI